MVEKGPLMGLDEEPFYESITDSTEDHIYAEVGDFDDIYEEPIKRKKAPVYVDIIPDENYYDEVADSDSNVYEEPIKLKPKVKSHDSFYNKRRGKVEHIYDEPPLEYNQNKQFNFKTEYNKPHLKQDGIRREPTSNNNPHLPINPYYTTKIQKDKEVVQKNHEPKSQRRSSSRQNLDKKSSINKLAKVIANGSKSHFRDKKNNQPYVKDEEVKKLTHLLQNIFKKAEYKVDSFESVTESDDSELKLEKSHRSRKNNIRLHKNRNESSGRYNDRNKIKKTTDDHRTSSSLSSNILDEPNLKEVLDSKIFLGD